MCRISSNSAWADLSLRQALLKIWKCIGSLYKAHLPVERRTITSFQQMNGKAYHLEAKDFMGGTRQCSTGRCNPLQGVHTHVTSSSSGLAWSHSVSSLALLPGPSTGGSATVAILFGMVRPTSGNVPESEE